ncbi:MAG: hypothetical protein M3N13_06310, partial [Candidatus Eremiobacteraeota bacterium]|nr:hypothetical protein [Candidatus Eremiobacteraeota bacterium]
IDAVVGALPRTSLALPNEMGSVELSAKSAPERPFIDVLEDLNDAVRHHGRFVVFAIDELQEAPIADLRDLIRFIHDTAGTDEPAFFVGAGLPNSPEHLHHVRTYTERWRYLRIGLLTHEETMEAIARPARERGIAVEDSALDRLAQESAGYPFFIQEYASAAWLQHTGKRITVSDVAAVVPGVRRFLEDEFYDARFRKLTPRECLYALAMADLGPGPHTTGEIAERVGAGSGQVSSIRNQLIKKDVAYSPSTGMLEFRIPLTERYVIQHRDELTRRARDVTMKRR